MKATLFAVCLILGAFAFYRPAPVAPAIPVAPAALPAPFASTPVSAKDAYKKAILQASRLIDDAADARLEMMKQEYAVAENAGDEDQKTRLMKEAADIHNDLLWVGTVLKR